MHMHSLVKRQNPDVSNYSDMDELDFQDKIKSYFIGVLKLKMFIKP